MPPPRPLAWSLERTCDVVVDGVRLDQPYCHTAEERVKRIIEDYRCEVERLREPPKLAVVVKTDPAEEPLREWPELEAFGGGGSRHELPTPERGWLK